MEHRWRGILGALCLMLGGGTTVALAYPYLVSAYHLEIGGRATANAIAKSDDLGLAAVHLQKAVQWDSGNAQAYRSLGKTYQAMGNWPAAVEALTQYTLVRPGSLSGYADLAQVYEEIEAAMTAMRLVDLVVSLPEAAVSAPDTPAFKPEVTQARYRLTPNSDERPALLMKAPVQVMYTLSLPPEPAIFRWSLAAPSDTVGTSEPGITYQVSVQGVQVLDEYVSQSSGHGGWQERAVDLAPWAGQEATLTLRALPDAVPTTADPWAIWGEPQVVDSRLPSLEALDPDLNLALTWRRSGLTSGDLIAQGEVARQAKQYDKALVWFRRALRMDPESGDAYYYMGQAYEDQALWAEALAAYQQAVGAAGGSAAAIRLRQVGESSVLFRIGVIQQRHLELPDLEEALGAYRAALAADNFETDWQAAWVHARLGQIYYARNKDSVSAETEILKAIDLAPEDKWLYVILGDLYRQEGRRPEAAAKYEQALGLDADFEEAQKRLDMLTESQ